MTISAVFRRSRAAKTPGCRLRGQSRSGVHLLYSKRHYSRSWRPFGGGAGFPPVGSSGAPHGRCPPPVGTAGSGEPSGGCGRRQLRRWRHPSRALCHPPEVSFPYRPFIQDGAFFPMAGSPPEGTETPARLQILERILYLFVTS